MSFDHSWDSYVRSKNSRADKTACRAKWRLTSTRLTSMSEKPLWMWPCRIPRYHVLCITWIVPAHSSSWIHQTPRTYNDWPSTTRLGSWQPHRNENWQFFARFYLRRSYWTNAYSLIKVSRDWTSFMKSLLSITKCLCPEVSLSTDSGGESTR